MSETGTCHCGAVTIEVATTPSVLTSCNCSICRRLGSLWAYYPPSDVKVTGPTVAYVSGDRMLELHHCPTCACTTHWSPIAGKADPNRMGINARLLSPEVVAAARVKRVDGASDTWKELE